MSNFGVKEKFSSKLLGAWAGVVFAYMFTPILVVVLFSFNGTKLPSGKWSQGAYNYQWKEFSFDPWRNIRQYKALEDAFIRSVIIALAAVVVSVILGTLMSLALVKYRFQGKGFINTLLVLPLTMPELVLGFSMLNLFASAGVKRGYVTIIIAHVMFCVSYITTTVKARIRGFDWHLEEAAADLGATPLTTFRKVTLPLIAPGIAAAALLTFALSLDDFIITYFNSGRVETFPVRIWNLKRSSIPPQLNVFATLILLVSAGLSVSGLVFRSWREKALTK
jgi:spermidine/putrescine transport system permease protein